MVEVYTNKVKEDEFADTIPSSLEVRDDFEGKVRSELEGGVFSDSQTEKPKVAGLDEILIYKTEDESIGDSTVLQDDNHFSVPLIANNNYFFDMMLRILSPTAGDFKANFSLPSGAAYTAFLISDSQGGGNQTSATVIESANFTVATNNLLQIIRLTGTINVGTTSGKAVFQWAKNASDPGTTTVYSGSWMRYHLLIKV